MNIHLLFFFFIIIDFQLNTLHLEMLNVENLSYYSFIITFQIEFSALFYSTNI